MLHCVRHVDILAMMPASAITRSSNCPAGPMNGMPGEIFLITRLLADEHEILKTSRLRRKRFASGIYRADMRRNALAASRSFSRLVVSGTGAGVNCRPILCGCE